MKICLSIAGIDPSGGAGIFADLKTFSAFGCYGAAVTTSLTYQNTQGVFGAVHQTAQSIRRQLRPILEDFRLDALKTGMLPTVGIIRETAGMVAENRLKNLVVDPVVRSTTGYDLIDDKALKLLTEKLFPLSELVTPNLPEAERIAGMKIRNEEDIGIAGRKIQSLGAKNVLLKGGHLPAGKDRRKSGKTADDYLFLDTEVHIFSGQYHETTATHGTGCSLAAAITANLALGKTLFEAVGIAKKFVNQAILTAPQIGRGNSPINHLVNFVPE